MKAAFQIADEMPVGSWWIEPTGVRYIKLGPGGDWLDRCIDQGVIELGHDAVPHTLAASGNWLAVRQLHLDRGATPSKASDFTRELRDFYTLPETALWITIGRGRLWWTFASKEVESISGEGRGSRLRRALGGWRDTDVNGDRLDLSMLSTRLTKVAAYRQTLCGVEAEGYLVRRINGVEEPAVTTARAAQAAAISAASDLIANLDWRDFELLVDLIFASSGWRRVSSVGGSGQADTDLILEQAATGERAFVQVKSRANQATLDDYVARFRASGMDRLFFACHSPGRLTPPQDPAVHLWLGDRLAAQAVKAGLLDWLIAKAS